MAARDHGVAAHKRTADAALDAGADDDPHRPFSRAELLARARAGLRAAQQRADDALVRGLMANVPGAIYRSAWHADYTLELISDEIERISGYPAANFIASKRRTLMSIMHPDDRDRVRDAVSLASEDGPFALEYRIIRADGEERWVLDRGHLVHGAGGRRWCDGATLWEEAVYDDAGTLVSGLFVDYLLPTAADTINFDIDHTTSPSTTNTLGTKGVGEAGTIASTPAVVNAIVDAVRHLGVNDILMPCPPPGAGVEGDQRRRRRRSRTHRRVS